MTIGTQGADTAFGVSVCPTDGSFSNVESMMNTHEDAVTTRHEQWVAAYKYAADQQLAMMLLSTAAQQFLATKAENAALDAADKQYDIANRQMVIAEEEFARYKEKYYCVENALTARACEPFAENPDYDLAENRAVRAARLAFAPQYEVMKRARARYCGCDNQRDLCDVATRESEAVMAAITTSYREEDSRAYARFTAYVAYQKEIFGNGRGVFNDQSALYTGAMATAITAIDAAAQARVNRYAAAGQGINQVLTAYFAPRIAAPGVYGGVVGNSGYGAQGTFSSTYNSGNATMSAMTPTPRPMDLGGGGINNGG